MTEDKELINTKELIEKIVRKYELAEQQVIQRFDIRLNEPLSKDAKNYLEGRISAFHEVLAIIAELRIPEKYSFESYLSKHYPRKK